MLMLLGAGLVLATLLCLAWFDVLPGGYRLRGWVEEHSIRRARLQKNHSDERLALFAQENPSAPAGSILFLGSSTIERFPLAQAFPQAVCLNRGIGNESLTECLARLDPSLPTQPPAGFVLYPASLDFRREGASPDVLVHRVRSLWRELRERYPQAPLAQIGLLSERDANPEFVARWRAANLALEAACAEANVTWVSTDRAPITSPRGTLAESYSDDRLHLNGEGYLALAGWLLAEGQALSRLLDPSQ